jgi:hypothetical protein
VNRAGTPSGAQLMLRPSGGLPLYVDVEVFGLSVGDIKT